MSIAEFYIENGLGEDYDIDDWLRDQQESLNGFGVGSVQRARRGGGGGGGAGSSARAADTECPACHRKFGSNSAMTDHYRDKQDATHTNHRQQGGAISSSVSGSKRRLPAPSAPAKRPKTPDAPMQMVDMSEFANCAPLADDDGWHMPLASLKLGNPAFARAKEARLQELHTGLQRRAAASGRPWHCSTVPSIFHSQGYATDKAPLEGVPSDPVERVALAEAFVKYGEAVEWRKHKTRYSSYWRCDATGRPSGPPLVIDLVEVAQQDAGDRYNFFSSASGVCLEACRLLQCKGLVFRGDLIAGNPSQAGPGLYSVRDPPLVKYARAGSVQMVAALLVAGAKIEQCLMWNEDHDYKDYNWRGDSALMAAAREGHKTVCAVLLAFGANKHHKCCYDEDKYDEGAAAAATRGKHPEVAAFIEWYPSHLAGHSSAPDDPSVVAVIKEASDAMRSLAAAPIPVEAAASRMEYFEPPQARSRPMYGWGGELHVQNLRAFERGEPLPRPW